MTDFGADVSFKKAAEKIKEHYGIEVSVSAVESITERHAEHMRENVDWIQMPNKSVAAPDQIIAETDGSMIPIVSMNHDIAGDKRKTRKSEWCEARLALARPKGSRSPIYGALIGSVDEAGKQLADVVKAVGRGKDSHVHGVGDGAPWIAEQFDKQFGSDGNYLIDFCHLSDYLHEASLCCEPTNSAEWFHAQQTLMKENKTNIVVNNLAHHINEDAQKVDLF